MASIKLKFRPSIVSGKEGTIYYQIIHKRVIRQMNTDYRLFKEEWNEETGLPAITTGERADFLLAIKERMDWDIKRLESIISRLEWSKAVFTADDIVSAFQGQDGQTFFVFMRDIISRLKQSGKARTAETYTSALGSLKKFREGKDLLFDEVTSDLMQLYEAHLQGRGLGKNTISFYNRILRATYNRAVEKGLTEQRYPFRHVYTGIEKTVKRAIPLEAVKRIKNLDLSLRPGLEFARDMFIFSFYTRGMSFIDMAYLKKKDLSDGVLTYRRRKTGQLLSIRWEKCMQEIVDRYDTGSGCYLLPIIRNAGENERAQYQNAMFLVNRKLKVIGRMTDLQLPLTMYVARHAWANAAKNKHIPLSVISEGMEHDSEQTTLIYLASLDRAVVDNANSLILNSLE